MRALVAMAAAIPGTAVPKVAVTAVLPKRETTR